MKLEDLRKKLRPEPKSVDQRKVDAATLRDEAGRPYTPVDPNTTHASANGSKASKLKITFQCGVCRAPVGDDLHCQACEDRDGLKDLKEQLRASDNAKERLRQNILGKVFPSKAPEPGLARLIATSLDERAGVNLIPGQDCSAIQVCPRPFGEVPRADVFKIHSGCVVTSLGRSLGTMFSRYYRPGPAVAPVLKATFWETYEFAVHIADPHSAAHLVKLWEDPKPPEYETIVDVRALRLMTEGKAGRRTLGAFNLYPAEVDGCGCSSPWDGARGDCDVCGGLGVVWRLRLHPMLLPEREVVEALERTAARLKT